MYSTETTDREDSSLVWGGGTIEWMTAGGNKERNIQMLSGGGVIKNHLRIVDQGEDRIHTLESREHKYVGTSDRP